MPDDNMPDGISDEDMAELIELDKGPDNFEGDPSETLEIIVPAYVDPQTEARWVTVAQAIDSWVSHDPVRANVLRAAIAEWALANRLNAELGKMATAWTRITAVHDGILRERAIAIVPPDWYIHPDIVKMVKSAPGGRARVGQLERFRGLVLAHDKPQAWFPFDLDEVEESVIGLIEAFEGKLHGGSLFGVN